MIRDNKLIEEEENPGGFPNNSSCYPLLHFSFKNISLSEILPLLNSIVREYDIENIIIRKRKRGLS